MLKAEPKVCEGCGSDRRTVYQHESGKKLCRICLVKLKKARREDEPPRRS